MGEGHKRGEHQSGVEVLKQSPRRAWCGRAATKKANTDFTMKDMKSTKFKVKLSEPFVAFVSFVSFVVSMSFVNCCIRDE
jgi:hypothetical protein